MERVAPVGKVTHEGAEEVPERCDPSRLPGLIEQALNGPTREAQLEVCKAINVLLIAMRAPGNEREEARAILKALDVKSLDGLVDSEGRSCHDEAVETLLTCGFPWALQIRPEDIQRRGVSKAPSGSVLYEMTTDPDTQAAAYLCCQAHVDAARALGFADHFVVTETFPTLALLSPLPDFLFRAMRGKKALNRVQHVPVLAHPDHGASCLAFDNGLKFRTRFSDGTLLTTTSYDTPAITDEKSNFYKIAVPGAASSAWNVHRDRVEKHLAMDKRVVPLDFKHLIDAQELDDVLTLPNTRRLSWLVLGPLMLGILGLIVGLIMSAGR